ncbi:MAG: NAD(P)H-dependent oxidoreductase [Archangium sp.]
MKTLVVYCHPNPKSFTHAVLESVHAGLARSGCEVQTLDLYGSGFEPVLVVNEEHRRRDLDKVEYTRPHREQIAWCDTMVFVYPVWWGGMPAMLKGYLDRTFVSGLCYSFQGLPKTQVFPTGLMRGKRAHFFYTLDSPALVSFVDPGWWSNYFTVFKYCGFSQVKRHYLARLKLTTPEQRTAWLSEVQERAALLGSATPAPRQSAG